MTSRPRILYVDEDASNSFTLATLLKLENYEPVTVNFASDALQFAQCEEFDLYLLSRRYPTGYGVYLCQQLHEIAPKTPIVFMSTNNEATGQPESIRSGSAEYVAKPGDAREVLEAVRLALTVSKNETMAVMSR